MLKDFDGRFFSRRIFPKGKCHFVAEGNGCHNARNRAKITPIDAIDRKK
jgi:hypothetical protein